jgi:hypothetical protein
MGRKIQRMRGTWNLYSSPCSLMLKFDLCWCLCWSVVRGKHCFIWYTPLQSTPARVKRSQRSPRSSSSTSTTAHGGVVAERSRRLVCARGEASRHGWFVLLPSSELAWTSLPPKSFPTWPRKQRRGKQWRGRWRQRGRWGGRCRRGSACASPAATGMKSGAVRAWRRREGRRTELEGREVTGTESLRLAKPGHEKTRWQSLFS